ncbi:MAG: sulfatase-like hydrolase/transferase [Candidatus Eisenbacteria bacterium]|nr:sulfatase-like hydrolase/transferase [Candidatus Eisenbacteria bacterium]
MTADRIDERAPMHRWGALGLAALLVLPCALLAGLVEALSSAGLGTADLTDVSYGALLHMLLAAALLLACRLLFWRQPLDRFPLLAFGAYLLLELAVVVPYWIVTAPWAPPLRSWVGRIFAAGIVLGGIALSVGMVALLVRRRRRGAGRAAAGGAAGKVGLLLLAGLILLGGVLMIRSWPRAERIALRPGAEARPRADLVVILIDTLRYDHLSFFGYPRPTSPNIDRLLSQSFVFRHAQTPSNKTIPSIASLFTGLYPTSCGVRGPFEAIPESAPTLAEHFRSYGYRTGAFIANRIVTPQGGFAQGFQRYFPPSAPWWTHRRHTAIEQLAQRTRRLPDTKYGWRINRAFFDWLGTDEASGEPLFAYLHYMEPHSPYAPGRDDLAAVAPGAPAGPSVPPLFQDYSEDARCIDWECLASPVTVPPEALAGMVARYDGEIRACDRHVGRLLEQLERRGLLARAHLLFLTDHGEQFGDHGGWYHGHAIYDELVRSPMAYRPPGGLAQGVVIDRPVAMLDLLRTLLEILELEVPPLHQGRPIPELLAGSESTGGPTGSGGEADRSPGLGEPEPAYPPRFAQAVLSELPPQLYALRLGAWKLVQRGDPEQPDLRLYHLQRDPGELRDVGAEQPDTLQLLRSYLLATLAGLERQRLDLIESRLDPETLQQLRDLGYIR